MKSHIKVALSRVVPFISMLIPGGVALQAASAQAAEQTAPLAVFTSQTLGIRFSYNAHPGPTFSVHTKVIGNRVYIYEENQKPETGQFVEILNKPAKESLQDAIRTRLLAKYSKSGCVVTTSMWKQNPTYRSAIISIPKDTPLEARFTTCQSSYASINGIAFFLEDTRHPNRYFFFSIGQYAIVAGPSQSWSDTFQILK